MEQRFVVTSNRGTLIDIGPERGLRFTSVRSPGPGKLVLEGEVPRSDGRAGRFRIEAFLPESSDWVKDLQDYVSAPADGPVYATHAPWEQS